MEARLIHRQTGKTIPVNKPVFRIGRNRSYVDYCVLNPAVSRHHCDLLEKDNRWYLTDHNSSNGTYVSGVKLMPNREVCLRSGDVLTLANEVFVFECDQPAQKWDVFLSFRNTDEAGLPTRDREMVESLHHALKAKGIRAFCASCFEGNPLSAVREAMQSSRILVAVGTSQKNLNSSSVAREVSTFRHHMFVGVKNTTTHTIVTYLSKDVERNTLPIELRMYQSFTEQDALVSFLESYLKQSADPHSREV